MKLMKRGTIVVIARRFEPQIGMYPRIIGPWDNWIGCTGEVVDYVSKVTHWYRVLVDPESPGGLTYGYHTTQLDRI